MKRVNAGDWTQFRSLPNLVERELHDTNYFPVKK